MEEPLIKQRIEQMDQTMQPGIDVLKWKSPDINEFINLAKTRVDAIHEIVTKMKNAINSIKQFLSNFNKIVIEKKSRPMSPDDYVSFQSGRL